MKTLICGSMAYDTIMVFKDQFKKHILPEQIHILNVAFLVPEMRREYGGCAGNIAYNLNLLGGNPLKNLGSRLQTLGKRLMESLPDFFIGYTPTPSLLHGDLWSGNHAYLADGTPVIFDSAIYYGDRECDLAMTELFGKFAADFYEAYRASFQLDAGYAMRRDLYILYHILNHANMFGGGYVAQSEQMMQKFLKSS